MIYLFLIFLSGVFNAVMDTLKFHYNTSVFSKWPNQNWVNPSLSWPNKWKPKSRLGDLIMSTVLVWVTDFWHLSKFLMLLLIFSSIAFYKPILGTWIDILISYCLFTITFELFFSYVFKLRK